MPGRTIGNVDLTTNGLPESGNEMVIFLGGQGIEFMIVATGAPDGQPKKSHARGIRHVIHFIIPGRLEFLLRQLGGENARPQKTGGAQGQRIVRRNFVSRHLPTNELIERHVPVECLDHEIPVMVSMRTVVVLFKPVTLGKTGHVQPMPRPALAEAGGLEQLVDHLVKGSVLLLHHVGQADQIKMSPPIESARVRFGIRGKPGLLQLRKDKAVDGISDPVLVIHLGRNGILQLGPCPMLGTFLLQFDRRPVDRLHRFGCTLLLRCKNEQRMKNPDPKNQAPNQGFFIRFHATTIKKSRKKPVNPMTSPAKRNLGELPLKP